MQIMQAPRLVADLLRHEFLFAELLLELVGLVERRLLLQLHRLHLLLDGVHRVRRHLVGSLSSGALKLQRSSRMRSIKDGVDERKGSD